MEVETQIPVQMEHGKITAGKILDLFFADSSLAIYIRNDKRITGLVTAGEILRYMRGEKESFINDHFKKILYKTKAQALAEAKCIFEENEKIIRVPVLNDKHEILYELMRKDRGIPIDRMDRRRFEQLYSEGEIPLINYLKENCLFKIGLLGKEAFWFLKKLKKAGTGIQLSVIETKRQVFTDVLKDNIYDLIIDVDGIDNGFRKKIYDVLKTSFLLEGWQEKTAYTHLKQLCDQADMAWYLKNMKKNDIFFCIRRKLI